MWAFHNSRDAAYRLPYGAVEAGTQVSLTIDVYDAPHAHVTLRTWSGEDGERRYDMVPTNAGTDGNWPDVVRYRATLTPKVAGDVWYHFIVTETNGYMQWFGAADGRVGGESSARDWEPPSFKLTVLEPDSMPQSWFQPVDGFLHDPGADRDLREIAETLRENHPAWALSDAISWGNNPEACEEAVRTMLDAGEEGANRRNDALKLFTCGGDPCLAVADRVLGIWRFDDAGNLVCTALNTSPDQAFDLLVPMADEAVSELTGGYGIQVVQLGEGADGETGTSLEALAQTPSCIPGAQPDYRVVPGIDRYARVGLWPFGSALLHFHKHERLQQPLEPGLGVLAHITSLPADGAWAEQDAQAVGNAGHDPHAKQPGTLGAPARAFVDWLAEAGARYWQVLPVNPTDEFGSPYAGISAFAGNTRLLEGDPNASALDPDAPETAAAYREFCERERDWLEPYAYFMAIRQKLEADGASPADAGANPCPAWQDWPVEYRRFDPERFGADADLARLAGGFKRAQFAFELQWADIRSYANEHGVRIIGDMPIYVSADSADVWAHPEIFQLGEDGRPQVVAGCPPDAFAVDGQVWGNPVYDWDALRVSDYDWWLRRLRRAFDLYDLVRLDHFIGFSRYFAIPAGQDACEGAYHPGPGMDFFHRAHQEFGALPIIAEDLGLITPGVRALSAACGFPGMDIAQFVDGNDPLAGYQPRPEKIAYSGTHDNQTLLGYCRARYQGTDVLQATGQVLENVVTCSADVCILPLQDLLGLGDEARMNTPGVAEGNWTWQADGASVRDSLERLEELVSLKG